ncbi:uncharacterized protein LOC110702684 [Chenopodium quinoa]|uniref:uncharacterized protein LOC110702684 n=1 Tax=Chenopodium quinoa TaxID=63459 RepID=UPI000B773DD0|nr:uncharacterized protein LOC110702684 [Chenopodium quinoa]
MHQSLQQPPKQSPNQTTNGNCYRCSKPGHWVKDCPQTGQSPFKNRSPLNNRSPVFHPTSTFDFPSTHCLCGAGLCEIRVSHSSANPDRKYYCCPGKFEYHCDYFKWCDRLKREEILEVQPKPYPTCGCGAGVCAVLKENGQTYFICPIKKGYGACNFRQLMEEDQESNVFSPEAIMQIDDVINRSLARRALDFSSEEVQGQMENGVGGSSVIVHRMSLRSSDALHAVKNNLNVGDTLVNNVEAAVPTTIVPAENQFSPGKVCMF